MMNDFLGKVEKIHNHFSDMNVIWFPFTFLKPNRDREIGIIRALIMGTGFGLSFAFYRVSGAILFGAAFYFGDIKRWLFTGIAIFTLWFLSVTRFFWNRRARRLLV